MERTLIQLKSDFADMAEKHKQINSFFWGNFVDAINQDAVDYPLMCCTLQPSQIGDSYTGVDLQVIICDKYNQQDYRMIDEVHSDMLRILKDIDVTLKQFRFQDYLDVETDFSTEPFINEGQDITAGWGGIIRMRVHDYENRCAIPYDGFDFDGSTTGTGCPEGVVVITDDEGNTLYTVTVDSNGNETQLIQDSTAVIKDTDGTILNTTSINAESSKDITAPDSTNNIQKSDGTLIESVTVPSGGTVNTNIADSPITVNSEAYTSLKATDSLNIPIVDSNGDAVNTTVVGSDVQVDDLPCAGGVTRTTATLMKTGQTISYATGDDGDLQEGRPTDFDTLDSAPVHNDGSATINTTTNRFTDTLGGQTYANDIVLDWSTWNGSTLLGYSLEVSTSTVVWATAVADCLAYTNGTFTSGWRMPNFNELVNICNHGRARFVIGSVFDSLNVYNLWTSTTRLGATSDARIINTPANNFLTRAKTLSFYYIPVRTFSLSLSNILT